MTSSRQRHRQSTAPAPVTPFLRRPILALPVLAILAAALYYALRPAAPQLPPPRMTGQAPPEQAEVVGWRARAEAVSKHFHRVYTPCWEGAYGAIGDAYLYDLTHDSTLLKFHLQDHDLRLMCEGTWVDDAAWICLAELRWWEATGKSATPLLGDAVRRYDEARTQGRLSSHEGFYSWYNWPPGAKVNEQIFTNSNMNQMATVACGLYAATGERRYLRDALLVWEGDGKLPGISQRLYRGKGVWEGRKGRAAFGKELPWGGVGYASLAAALYKATHRNVFKENAVASVKFLLDPANGWVDPVDFYQIHMDGNGAFVNFLFDAYAIAPEELAEVPVKVGKMLEHVWSNHQGRASRLLHRKEDHAIRNGWNPDGGEDGYGVDEVGTVHAQGEAARAFGVFAYYSGRRSP
jgi:hypothetical protein